MSIARKSLKKRIASAILSVVMLTSTVCTGASYTSISAMAASTLSAPTSIKTSQTQNSVTLSWKAVNGAMAYRVFLYNSSTKKYEVYADTPDLTYTVNNLNPAATYKFSVAALAAAGDNIAVQKKSSAITVKTKSAAATKNLAAPKVTATVTETSVTLKWGKISGASAYRVYQYDSAKSTYTKYKDVTSVTCKITGLTTGNTYRYAVAALKKVSGKNVPQTLSMLVTAVPASKASADRNTSTDKSITLNSADKLPVEAGEYNYGAWYSKFRISDFTYEVEDYYEKNGNKELVIKLQGEVTECNKLDDVYQSVNVTLYDSEGYAVKTRSASRSTTTGKFKDMSVTFYDIAPGKYTFSVSDYGSGDKPKSESEKEDELKGCTIDLPTVPYTINYYDYKGTTVQETCVVTDISCEVDGTNLIIYFSGKKTYDKRGSGQSNSCKIGWKLYEITPEGNLVVDDDTAYTKSLKMGEMFKNISDTAYGCIEKGKHYRLEILNVN